MGKINFVVMCFVLILTGCAPKVWEKAGAGQQDFERDKYACMQSSRQQVQTTRSVFDGRCNCMVNVPYSGVELNEGMFDACMGSKGYRQSR